MSHSGHLLVTVGDPTFHGTGVSWRQRPLCAAEMWTKSVAKWESTGGWSRRERGQNPKSHEIPECLAMCWLANQRYGMTAGPVLNYPLHAFILRKVQWLIYGMGRSLPFGFCDDSTLGLLKGDFSISDRLFLLLGKVVATKISTLSRVKSLQQNPLDMKKEVAFNDFWSNVDLIITTATRIFFDVGVQDPLVAPWGSPQY